MRHLSLSESAQIKEWSRSAFGPRQHNEDTMPIKDPQARAAHMANMRAARLARTARQTASDTGGSIDEIAAAPPTPRPTKRAPLKKAQPVKKRTPLHANRDQAPPKAPVKRVSHVREDHRPIQPRRDPTVVREGRRDPHTGRIVITRGGREWTRRIVDTGDKFSIDRADIPDGMSYQWVAVTVTGAEQRNSVRGFYQNGWEPVCMSRYPGRYGPPDATGDIIIDGLQLCERPEDLTREARAEEIEAAKGLIRTRNEQFVPRLPEALERRGTGLRAKRSIEGMPGDIGRPVYEMAVDEGLV